MPLLWLAYEQLRPDCLPAELLVTQPMDLAYDASADRIEKEPLTLSMSLAGSDRLV